MRKDPRRAAAASRLALVLMLLLAPGPVCWGRREGMGSDEGPACFAPLCSSDSISGVSLDPSNCVISIHNATARGRARCTQAPRHGDVWQDRVRAARRAWRVAGCVVSDGEASRLARQRQNETSGGTAEKSR